MNLEYIILDKSNNDILKSFYLGSTFIPGTCMLGND